MAGYKYIRHTAEEIDEAIDTEREHCADTVTHTCKEEKAAWNTATQQAGTAAVTLGYEKRNFLANNAEGRERYGVTAVVNEDGSITLNGSNTTGSSFMLFSNLQAGTTINGTQFDHTKHVPSGEYIMTGGAKGATLQMRLSDTKNDEGSYVSCTTGKAEVTITDAHLYVWCRVLISAGASFDNVTLYPMLRLKTDTDDTFKKYQPSVYDALNDALTRITALEAALVSATGGGTD